MSEGTAARFVGKKAIVTGAASGIGRGVALRLGSEGAALALFDIAGDGLKETCKQLESLGAQASSYVVDISKRDQVVSGVQSAVEHMGGLDALVNCAGISLRTPSLEITEEEWDRVLDINLKGTFLMSQAAGIAMKSTGGAIVNISSVAAELASGESVHYAASKGGIRQLTKGMAVSLAPFNIRVNAVGPGPIESAMSQGRKALDGGDSLLMNRVLRGHMGKPADIAAAVAYLASDEADFVTGTTLYVDGGVLAPR